MERGALSSLRYHHDDRDEKLSALITYHFSVFVHVQFSVSPILTVQTFYLLYISPSRPLEDSLMCSSICSHSLCQHKNISVNAPDYLMSVAFMLIEDERKIKCLQNRIIIPFSVCFVIT